VNAGLRRTVSAWLRAARLVGGLVLLIGGSAALGLLIAWPLWRFATGARGPYTIFVLVVAAGGIVYLVVRRLQRNAAEARDPSLPRRSVSAGLLTAARVVIGVCGAYLAAALLARGFWILGASAAVVWGLLLWLLGRAHRAAIQRKERLHPAENGNE
jgi:hypothetical protein